jgi:3-methyladenine DNA glycosylase AlkC
MNILDPSIENNIQTEVIPALLDGRYREATEGITAALDALYANIPANKRISYGVVHTIKVLSEFLCEHLEQTGTPIFENAAKLFEQCEESRVRGVALGMLSFYGVGDYPKVLPYFEQAAAATDWQTREHAQMFFRRLIKKYPAEMKEFLLRLVDSPDANLRRFVGETLRPVQENQWFYKDPEYSLTVLRRMFRERSPYPRTSVGNNLSDLARRLPELVYELVAELVASGDRNSYWIASRACRNLVKKEPKRVMELLGITEYRYKKTVYK